MEVGDKCPKCGDALSEHQVIQARTKKVETRTFRCDNGECGWTSVTGEILPILGGYSGG